MELHICNLKVSLGPLNAHKINFNFSLKCVHNINRQLENWYHDIRTYCMSLCSIFHKYRPGQPIWNSHSTINVSNRLPRSVLFVYYFDVFKGNRHNFYLHNTRIHAYTYFWATTQRIFYKKIYTYLFWPSIRMLQVDKYRQKVLYLRWSTCNGAEIPIEA